MGFSMWLVLAGGILTVNNMYFEFYFDPSWFRSHCELRNLKKKKCLIMYIMNYHLWKWSPTETSNIQNVVFKSPDYKPKPTNNLYMVPDICED